MRGNSIMAGPLLWVALAATLVHGCLLPQDDQVFPVLPPFRNTSPRVDLAQISPDQNGATIQLGNNCSPFVIAVKDPDKGDTIRSRWFVDPDKAFTTPATEGEAGSDPRVIRPIRAFYAPNGRLALPNPMGLNSHKVTVVIADREFQPEGIKLRLSEFIIDGGVIKEESEPVTYTWEVATDPSTPCP